MKIVNKLIEYGIIQEFNDWAQHFLAGTKGQPKTDPIIVDYVKSILEDVFPDQPEKVKNCRLAPWLIAIVSTLGPENIGTVERNKMIDVANWFKTTGSEGPFKNRDLNSAYEFVVAKNIEDNRKKEQKPEEGETFQLKAEKEGRIRRVGNVGDGSGRIWVEVIDGSWMAEPSELNQHHKWGVKCQSEQQHGLQSKDMLNIQLIGPPKGNPNGKWSTQLAMASPRGTGNIKEVKQEGNQQPGSMKTSSGYNDGAEMVVNFLCGNPFAKQHLKRFTLYTGEVPTSRSSPSQYGGNTFLIYLSDRQPELFNKLMDCRDDILENNRDLVIALKGQEWFEERELNLQELASKNPEIFLRRFERLYKRFGQDAVEALNHIDVENILKRNRDLFKEVISSMVGRISPERFMNLFKMLDIKDYIASYPNEFKNMLKFMSNDKAYKELLDYLMSTNPEVFFSAFGRSTQGILNFMSFASSPRLREHQDAQWDSAKEEWWRWKTEYLRDENGNIRTDENGNRLTTQKKMTIPENLLFMDQKERKKFIEKNKDFILSVPMGTDFEKKLTYLKILLPQLSEQEAKKLLETNDLKGQIIKYYDDKYNEFKADKSKGDQYLLSKYGRNVQGVGGKILQSYIPGILEFYRQFRVGKPENRKIPLPELKANINKIKNYYADISNEKDLPGQKMDGFAKFLELYKQNGAPDEEIIKLIDSVDKTAFAKSPAMASRFFSMVLSVLSKSKAVSEASKLKSFFDKMGASGEGYYNELIKNLSILQYSVNSGDRIMFKGNQGFREEFKLTKGKKYLVIETRDTYKKNLEDAEESDIDNIEAINAEVLVSEDDSAQGFGGQNIWVPSDRFEVKSKYVLMSSKLNESFGKFGSSFKKLKATINESMIEEKPRYTAVMLDNDSMSKLQQLVDELKNEGIIGDDWKITADHVTINLGAAKNKSILGQQVMVDAIAIGRDDKVVALKVAVNTNLDFGGRIPHITLAFNKNAGAKPVMSNDLKEWKLITTIKLKGNIEEVF